MLSRRLTPTPHRSLRDATSRKRTRGYIRGLPVRGLHLGLLALTVSLAACGPRPLAEAEGNRLTVDAAARLILDHSTKPGDMQVVRVVAELWVDYTLLAGRLHDDTALASLDVEMVARPALEQIMLGRLREEVVQVDTVVSDEELAARFAADMPGARATASQILLLFPRGATTRQRDSVRTLAAGLRNQLERGADFATLAGRHSDDPGSGRRGGSLGTFGRGEMLAEVDEAVFRLAPGELSAPVETDLGYHLLRLDALEIPALSEVADEFRRRIQQERMAVAEAAYIARLDTASGLALAEDALEIARALAAAPPSRLSGGAARRPLLTWEGGTYSVGEFAQLFESATVEFSDGVAAASDEELEAALRRMGQEELLLEDASSRGLATTEAEADSIAEEVRSAIRNVARAIGLMPGTGGAGHDGAEAQDGAPDSAAEAVAGPGPATVAELVEAALVRIVSGEREVVPLGSVTFLLRNQGTWRIREGRVEATVARIGEIRSL